MDENNYYNMILDSLPHWCMLTDARTRTILAANKKAKELGSVVGGQCWDDFGHRCSLSEDHLRLISTNPERKRDNCIKCTFCEADEATKEHKTHVEEVKIDGTTWRTYWVPIEKDIYLHYAIDMTEREQFEEMRIKTTQLDATLKAAGAVCHEMSQPLMIIMGQLDLMKSELPDDYEHVFELIN